MDDAYVMSQINKHSEKIAKIEASFVYLQSSLDKLSISIDKLAEKVDAKKGLGAFLKENWFRIPTMVVLVYGIVWMGNYVNDNFLPEHSKYVNSK
jgi:hypothetical protein